MIAMPHVMVRDLPDDVHRRLLNRAQAEGQSLQSYLLAELTRLARGTTLEDIVARIEANEGGRVGLIQAVQDLDQLRNVE